MNIIKAFVRYYNVNRLYNSFNLQIENMSHLDLCVAFVLHFSDNKFEHFYHKMCNCDSINVAVWLSMFLQCDPSHISLTGSAAKSSGITGQFPTCEMNIGVVRFIRRCKMGRTKGHRLVSFQIECCIEIRDGNFTLSTYWRPLKMLEWLLCFAIIGIQTTSYLSITSISWY